MQHLKLALNRWTIMYGATVGFTFFGLAYVNNEAGHLTLTLVAFVIAYFLNVTVHELGHALAGFAVRFKFSTFAVGPFFIVNTRGKLSLHFLPRLTRLDGFARFLPSDEMRLCQRMLVYIAGGPIATLIFGIIALIIGPYQVWPLSTTLNCATFIAFVIFIINLIPQSAPDLSWSTDGYILAKLLSDEAHSDRWLAIYMVQQANFNGQRPREWPDYWIHRSTALNDQSVDGVRADYLAYRWALDCGKYSEAQQFLGRMIEARFKVPHVMRATILVEASFFEMYHNRNYSKAEDWLKQVGNFGKLVQPVLNLRLVAVANLALGKKNVAQAVAMKALNIVNRSQDGIHRGERVMIEDILVACQSPLR